MLNLDVRGQIIERQTTFVRFVTSENVEYKIMYLDKHEFVIKDLCFKGCVIVDQHPILEQYEQPIVDIYISSEIEPASVLTMNLKSLIDDEYGGWRSVRQYLNPQYDTCALLEGGFGLLYSGPENIANRVAAMINSRGIKFNMVQKQLRDRPKVRALIMGRNAVVANDFLVTAVVL